jgi:hypothetical protein
MERGIHHIGARRLGAALLALLSCLALCGASCWGVRAAAVAPFVLPQASELDATWQGLGRIRVTYRAPGEPFTWRGALAQRLEAAGWRGRSFSNVGARRPPFVTIWYTHETVLGPIVLVERAVFGGDADAPDLAIVDVARELRFEW